MPRLWIAFSAPGSSIPRRRAWQAIWQRYCASVGISAAHRWKLRFSASCGQGNALQRCGEAIIALLVRRIGGM